MALSLVEKTAAYVKIKMAAEPTGHDWYHIERVWKMAKYVQAREGGALELIELAALLHDLGDDKHYEFNEEKGPLMLHGMMDILEIDEDKKKKIIKIINESQYNGDETKKPNSVEGQILQDVLSLDILGAVGIARTFATGGHIGRKLHDPHRKVKKRLRKAEFQKRKKEGTSINYFYEKVLRLPEFINTTTARLLAEKRLAYTKNFLVEFLDEWEGE